jgi:hypothetical protein
MTPCVVCIVHMETRNTSFLVEPQNQGRWVFQVETQNRQLWFGDLGLKITALVSWFDPQNQAGFGLSVPPQNRHKEVSVGHVPRSSGLLRLEASRVRIFQSGLKTGGDVTAGGTRGIITDVALR